MSLSRPFRAYSLYSFYIIPKTLTHSPISSRENFTHSPIPTVLILIYLWIPSYLEILTHSHGAEIALNLKSLLIPIHLPYSIPQMQIRPCFEPYNSIITLLILPYSQCCKNFTHSHGLAKTLLILIPPKTLLILMDRGNNLNSLNSLNLWNLWNSLNLWNVWNSLNSLNNLNSLYYENTR